MKASVLCVVILSVVFVAKFNAMPLPWTSELQYGDKGDDVLKLQVLMERDDCCRLWLEASSEYLNSTADAVSLFQAAHDLSVTGIFDSATASLLLKLHLDDGYKDDGQIPDGFLYKVHVPVHHNRSIETKATLFDSNMNILHEFIVRAHGQGDGVGFNEITNSGNTPTGLSTFDLNSPEDPPASYGPYPVNRMVHGLAGNHKWLIPGVRDGLLMHTGEWPHWDPSQPMPNSHGCIHGHPDDIKQVISLIEGLGVKVRPNTNGALPYPYKPQGVISVELID